MRSLDGVAGLTAADLMHRHVSSVSAEATLGELRAYFAASASRRLALVVDGERYVGAVEPAMIDAAADDASPAAALASAEPSVDPTASALEARERALAQASGRLPVVDGDGVLVGIIAVNRRRDGFCGT